jgi:hypothetical protein
MVKERRSKTSNGFLIARDGENSENAGTIFAIPSKNILGILLFDCKYQVEQWSSA